VSALLRAWAARMSPLDKLTFAVLAGQTAVVACIIVVRLARLVGAE